MQTIENKIQKMDSKIENAQQHLQAFEKKVEQLEHRKILAENEEKERCRKARTLRLIERGAMLESFIPNAENLTNEQVMDLLKIHFGGN
jgi:butyrate kinase